MLFRQKVLLLLLVTCAMFTYTLFHVSTENKPNQNHVISKSRELLASVTKQTLKYCPEYNQDCVRFERLLQDWPDHKPKAAFYILTQKTRMQRLKTALNSIDTYFNDKFRYPVIIFHESDMGPSLPQIRSWSRSALFFQEINFTLPDFLPKPVPYKIDCMSSIGYRHMCRFHSKMIYKEPIIQGLEFYWRLDDDSRLKRHVNYDVFKFMNKRKLDYGYTWLHLDSSLCTQGLWEAASTFIKQKHIKTQFFKEWSPPRMFYNNFEIGRMSVWLSKQYTEYADYIDRQGGIYYHRWGDAPIKGIAVAMFVPKNKTHHFKDIGYQHGSYINI